MNLSRISHDGAGPAPATDRTCRNALRMRCSTVPIGQLESEPRHRLRIIEDNRNIRTDNHQRKCTRHCIRPIRGITTNNEVYTLTGPTHSTSWGCLHCDQGCSGPCRQRKAAGGKVLYPHVSGAIAVSISQSHIDKSRWAESPVWSV